LHGFWKNSPDFFRLVKIPAGKGKVHKKVPPIDEICGTRK